EGLTDIDWYAFVNCTSLIKISFPKSLSLLGGAVFKGCTSIKKIFISENIEQIGNHLFEDCKSLERIDVAAGNETYSSIDGVLCDQSQTTLITFPYNKSKTYTIPVSITSIGQDAFWSSSIENIVIGENVKEIGSHAFYACRLQEITVAANVDIGD